MGNGVNSSVQTYRTFNPDSLSSTLPRWLMSGDKWGSATMGSGTTLTVSFATASSAYKSGYGQNQDNGVVALTTQQKTAANAVLDAYSDVANLNFNLVSDTSTRAGDIRFANTTSNGVDTAEAFYPSSAAEGGDIWFGDRYNYKSPAPGNYAYSTFLHETGHALGLQHPHEDSSTPASRDALKFSVMSYRSYVNGPLSLSGNFYPTTLMLDDILAIQTIYGRNTSFRTGNNTYSWDSDERIFETIWDGGGLDTIDASNQSQGVILKLAEGNYSTIGRSFSNGQSAVRDCLAIAYGCKIERAIGSEHADSLIGNSYNNNLRGENGNDFLAGVGGNDKLTGGSGADKFLFHSALSATSNVDTILDFSLSGGDVIQLDNAIFTRFSTTGGLNSGNFRASASGNAVESNDFILYELDTGKLFYDFDGNGAGAKTPFALIGTNSHAALTYADFAIT